ncbi:Enoyl-CoA hydratase/isomerase [Pseudooceanicola nitratireducens]|jgi:enoyl-CoA hydratase|uniref:Enoyl-CoA hydratase/isomerase n=2 Tax=Pseudooceanicola nitratireducens TaxID=517719 RepID=A0A1I1QM43_9RHOB|nr:Enoyl-CoA hydratase/isomerase [Pseudooceanicola nitratireducens]SFD19150.1 Enoyl-CoA hydratase/isomerase [Pseudooceanicola nitratireducens]
MDARDRNNRRALPRSAAPPMTHHIQTETQGAVAILRLARPARGNALDAGMADLFAQFLVSWRADPGIAACVICAEGADFCTGSDYGDLPQTLWSHRAAPWTRLQEALIPFDKPLVLAARGRAAGIGLALILKAHAVVAEPCLAPAMTPAPVRPSAQAGARQQLEFLAQRRRRELEKTIAAKLKSHPARPGTSVTGALALAHRIAVLPRNEVEREMINLRRGSGPRPEGRATA